MGYLLSDADEERAVVECCVAEAGAVLRPSGGDIRWVGKVAGSAGNTDRGVSAWIRFYLSPTPTNNRTHFRTRFPVPMRLYRALERELPVVEPLLLQRADCAGRAGHPLHVKILCALRR